jgi:hypothetical protein
MSKYTIDGPQAHWNDLNNWLPNTYMKLGFVIEIEDNRPEFGRVNSLLPNLEEIAKEVEKLRLILKRKRLKAKGGPD